MHYVHLLLPVISLGWWRCSFLFSLSSFPHPPLSFSTDSSTRFCCCPRLFIGAARGDKPDTMRPTTPREGPQLSASWIVLDREGEEVAVQQVRPRKKRKEERDRVDTPRGIVDSPLLLVLSLLGHTHSKARVTPMSLIKTTKRRCWGCCPFTRTRWLLFRAVPVRCGGACSVCWTAGPWLRLLQ